LEIEGFSIDFESGGECKPAAAFLNHLRAP
jgi:hypothetical protein